MAGRGGGTSFGPGRQKAQHAYRKFVREGRGQASPWAQVRGQIFLGGEGFLAQVEQRLRKQSVANVPRAQTHPTRLTPAEVCTRVAQAYGVREQELVRRVHPEAYQCAAWLLRRAANEPLQRVAKRFGCQFSAFHISSARSPPCCQAWPSRRRRICAKSSNDPIQDLVGRVPRGCLSAWVLRR